MRTVAVSLTRATSNRGSSQGPQSAGSVPNQQHQRGRLPSRQVSAAEIPQSVGGHATSDECQESPHSLEASKGSQETNASSELSSFPSTSRNKPSGSTQSVVSDPGSGDEGDNEDTDNEDTDTSGTRTYCIHLVEYYDKEIEHLEEEKRKEGGIMDCIGINMTTVSAMSDVIRGHVQRMFGVQRLRAARPRKFSRYLKKGTRWTVQEEATRGPNRDFERRLQAIRAYVDNGCDESQAIPAADADGEASTAPIPEEGACSSTSSDAERATESSPSGAVADCSREISPTVVTPTLRQQSYEESVRRREAARESWGDKMAAVMSDVLEKRVLKGKHTCRTMLRCMKSVADVVSLALVSYRAAELAVQKARTSADDDTLHAMKTAAAETSVCMWKSLKQAEAAVEIHAEIVGATKKSEQLLSILKSENPDIDDVLREVKAMVAHLRLLTPRLAYQQSGEQESGYSRATPQPGPSGEASRTSAATGDAAEVQSLPVTVLNNLLSATNSSLQAVGEATKALHLFSTSVSCSGKKSRKSRGCAKKIVKDKDRP